MALDDARPEQPDDGVALVLAGAVAQGAFGVGAVTSLAEKGWPVQRIAATSSGALTGAVVAAGAATGQLAYAAEVAADLWVNHGDFADIRHVNPADWLRGRGLLDTSRLVSLVEEGIRRVVERAGEPKARPHQTGEPKARPQKTGGAAAAPKLRVTLVTASLNAVPEGAGPLPTYEKAVVFNAPDFLDPTKWTRIATAAAASATFPGLFSPTMLDGMPCVDGGAVNNAPISYVLDDPGVRRVVVVTSEPSPLPAATEFGGVDLLGRLADVLINERISHDLGVALRANAMVQEVRDALASTGASEVTRVAVLRALRWRPLDLLVVHPDPPLEGSSFAGFFDRSLRESYVRAGVLAGRRALGLEPSTQPVTV
jgi:NTE family protein